MSARLLLEVTIRVLGLWSLYAAISATLHSLAVIMGFLRTTGASIFLVSLGQFAVLAVVQCVLGLMLIWWAPRIASRFYPAGADEAEVHLNVGPGDVYRVACFILGVYLLVRAAEPASIVVATAMQGNWAKWNHAQMIGQGVAALVSVAVGIVLVFGSERIGNLLSNLRYDPNTIPKQQFSLRILLAFMLLVAVVIGVIRVLTVGVP